LGTATLLVCIAGNASLEVIQALVRVMARARHRCAFVLLLLQAAALAPFHHSAVKCRNIERSMLFYSLFGFEEECRFRSGAARCAWLTGASTRLELVEVPSYVNATSAPDGLAAEAVGLNHLCFDVTDDAGDGDLAAFLGRLNARSEERFRKSLRLALEPQQLLAGGAAYEYAFVADPDGVLVELIRRRNALGVEPEVDDW